LNGVNVIIDTITNERCRMTTWVPRISGRAGPKYRAIADALAQDVQSGALQPGTKLPTHRELAHELGVTVGTVSRSYAEVQRLGLVSGEVGRGSFVGGEPGLSTLGEKAETSAGLVDLSLNYPATAGIEEAVVRNALVALGTRSQIRNLLGYQHNGATLEQRAAAAAWLANSDIAPAPDDIVLSCGAQHALAVSLSAICEAGDTVATEALSYPGIRALSLMLGLRLKGVAMDEQGMLPDAFKAACESTQVRALYTIPTLHNPTTATMSPARRKAILEIALQHDVIVVEDDVYGFMTPNRPPSMAKLAPEQTIYVTSVSKWLAAGLRIGFAVPPRRLLPRLTAMVRTTVWMTPPPMLECFRIMVENGDALKLAKARIAETRARQTLAKKLLAGLEWQSDASGSHMWLKLPSSWDGYDFVSQARRQGVLLLAADSFAVTRHSGDGHVRLCLGSPALRADLARGLGVLTQVLNEDPHLLSTYF
jgi:DNA-binding transcriptional MocR family regulator